MKLEYLERELKSIPDKNKLVVVKIHNGLRDEILAVTAVETDGERVVLCVGEMDESAESKGLTGIIAERISNFRIRNEVCSA